MYQKGMTGWIAGMFKNSVAYGYCQFHDKVVNITDIYGVYKSIKFKKDARIEYKDNRKYFGELSGFLPHGKGKMLYPDGSVIIGRFKKGEVFKDAILIENDKKFEVAYSKGKCIKKIEWRFEV